MHLLADAISTAPNGYLVPLLGCREPVSGLTHLVSAVIAAAGGALLWSRSRGDRGKQASMAVYASSLVGLYLASATYHIVDCEPGRLVLLRKLDHASIFLLIAGTFTPFFVNGATGGWRFGNLVMIWSLAVLGVGLKVLFIDLPDGVSAGLYVAMGWLSLIGYAKLARSLSHHAMAWCAVGGVIYSAGAAVDVVQWPVPFPGFFGFHEVLHVLVMAASAVHFGVVLRYVVPVVRYPAMRRSLSPVGA